MLVLTGAVISLASGDPTFRGSDKGAVWSRDVTESARIVTSGAILRLVECTGGAPDPRCGRSRTLPLRARRRNGARAGGRGGEFLLVTQNMIRSTTGKGCSLREKVHARPTGLAADVRRCPLSFTATDRGVADLDSRRSSVSRKWNHSSLSECYA